MRITQTTNGVMVSEEDALVVIPGARLTVERYGEVTITVPEPDTTLERRTVEARL